VGVGNAIKMDNNRLIGVGFDKSDATMKLLEANSLNVIIAQNPYTMGYLGMAEAYAALNGFNTGPSYINTGVTVIRKR
jgi:ribose transport system substrate-binding protein